MQDEPRDNHEREKGVERKGNRIIWRAEVDGHGGPSATARLQSLVAGEHDSYHCTSVVS